MEQDESAGLHIIMDARVVDCSVFNQEKIIHLFEQIVQALDMKPIDSPRVYEVPVDQAILERVKITGKFEDEGGISAIQVISTSHLSIHAWPLQKYFALDAFSCKDFDEHKALSIIRETMGVTTENTMVINRQKPKEDGTGHDVRRYKFLHDGDYRKSQ
jgi:S-adenosylmethionine/arginine decarboxylase-like enzyme